MEQQNQRDDLARHLAWDIMRRLGEVCGVRPTLDRNDALKLGGHILDRVAALPPPEGGNIPAVRLRQLRTLLDKDRFAPYNLRDDGGETVIVGPTGEVVARIHAFVSSGEFEARPEFYNHGFKEAQGLGREVLAAYDALINEPSIDCKHASEALQELIEGWAGESGDLIVNGRSAMECLKKLTAAAQRSSAMDDERRRLEQENILLRKRVADLEAQAAPAKAVDTDAAAAIGAFEYAVRAVLARVPHQEMQVGTSRADAEVALKQLSAAALQVAPLRAKLAELIQDRDGIAAMRRDDNAQLAFMQERALKAEAQLSSLDQQASALRARLNRVEDTLQREREQRAKLERVHAPGGPCGWHEEFIREQGRRIHLQQVLYDLGRAAWAVVTGARSNKEISEQFWGEMRKRAEGLGAVLDLVGADQNLKTMPVFIPLARIESVLAFTLTEVRSSVIGRYTIRKIKQRMLEEDFTGPSSQPNTGPAEAVPTDDAQETVEALAAHAGCITRIAMLLGVRSSFQEVEEAVATLITGVRQVREYASRGIMEATQGSLRASRAILALTPALPGEKAPRPDEELNALLSSLSGHPDSTVFCYIAETAGGFQVEASGLLRLADRDAQLSRVLLIVQNLDLLLGLAKEHYDTAEVIVGAREAMLGSVRKLREHILESISTGRAPVITWTTSAASVSGSSR